MIKEFKMKSGKVLIAEMAGTGSITVRYKQGGSLPNSLTGKFTRWDLVERAINRYLLSHKPRKVRSKSKEM